MRLSNYALDKVVSQHLSELTENNAPDMKRRYPRRQTQSWVSTFIPNSFLGNSVTKEGRTFAFYFLRRAEAAFAEYAYARQALSKFVSTVPRKSSLYFKALHHFEITVAMLWQAYELIKKVCLEPKDEKLFEKNDGSTLNKLSHINNVSKHANPADLAEDSIHAVWITNDGIKTENHHLLYSEVVDLLKEVARWADIISRVEVPPKD